MRVSAVTTNPVSLRGILDAKKRGQELTRAHIEYFVKGVVERTTPDYQAAAFLMAVRTMGMTDAETIALTKAMTDFGKRLDLSRVEGRGC